MKWGLAMPLAMFGVTADVPPGGHPCFREGGDVLPFVSYEDCIDLLWPRRFRGTWFVALEESSFLPAGRPLPAVRTFSETERPPEWGGAPGGGQLPVTVPIVEISDAGKAAGKSCAPSRSSFMAVG